MPDAHRLLEALSPHTGNASHHFDLAKVLLLGTLENEIRGVDFPAPGRSDRVSTVAPAEDALVGTGEGWRRFHAEMRGYAVEGVLVAGATATESRLGPPTDLDARVGANDAVALLCKGSIGRRGDGDHFFERRRLSGRGSARGGCEVDRKEGRDFHADVFQVRNVLGFGSLGLVGRPGGFGFEFQGVIQVFLYFFVTFNRITASRHTFS